MEKEPFYYDPISGRGCRGERVEVGYAGTEYRICRIPKAMTEDPEYAMATKERGAWIRLRVRYDFEFWAAYAVRIKDKVSAAMVPFVLNAPQRILLDAMERQREAGKPIRIILLKARQWGGSTLIQMYMAWIQMVHRTNWHSLIAAHVKDTARAIRRMYDDMLASYPEDLLEPDQPKPVFRTFEGSQNIRTIEGRGCRITVGSAESQEALRGADIAMAHLSETAFWPATDRHDPSDFIRTVAGTVARLPYTLVAVESTANGVGNYFHSEWLRRSDKVKVFVPWFEIEHYTERVDDEEALLGSLDPYEQWLRDECGCTPGQIQWYRSKMSECQTRSQMHAEFPSTPEEAFTSTGGNVFSSEAVEALRTGCRAPEWVGDMTDGPAGRFVEDAATGCLSVWEKPREGEAYIVAVDIGGRSSAADYSVVAVLTMAERPRVVAQWRGHIDHDLLADRAMAVARWYNRALLVVESNTLESQGDELSPMSVLSRVAATYPNVYYRHVPEVGSAGIGFHTNRRTKPQIVNTLITALRTGGYVERDETACNELATYERLPGGSYAARRGCHDDVLMTRAMALYVAGEQLETSAADPEEVRRVMKFSGH